MGRLSQRERDRMRKDNYEKFNEQLKTQKGPPPIPDSVKRAGPGKGDASRITNYKKYQQNYNTIFWNSKKDKIITKKAKSITELILESGGKLKKGDSK